MDNGGHLSEKISDEQLVQLHLAGRKGAFETLLRRRGGEVYRFLVRMLGDQTLADDVLQETFLQLHLSADRFDVSRRFKPWLFTIAANKARDALRSQSRRKTQPLDAQISETSEASTSYLDLLQADIHMPSEQMQNQELRSAVQKMVMEMPEHLREVILLSYFHHMSYKEIADVLAVPLGTVKSRLHAAVSHFAHRWESVGKRFADE
ncbi:MAG: RNA polymerase sigma factor [Planctomycetes bacterium]|nr:RNA polymerase sigma factor [Planctomycetota bacterium]